MRCSPIFRLCGHIPKPLDLAEGLDVPHVILHSQDLVHVLDLDQRHEILHEIVGRPVAAVEAVECRTVNTLLPCAGDADHVFFVFLTQGIHDSPNRRSASTGKGPAFGAEDTSGSHTANGAAHPLSV